MKSDVKSSSFGKRCLDQTKVKFIGAVQKIYDETMDEDVLFNHNTFQVGEKVIMGVTAESYVEDITVIHFSFEDVEISNTEFKSFEDYQIKLEKFTKLCLDIISFLLEIEPLIFDLHIKENVIHFYVSPPTWWHLMRN